VAAVLLAALANGTKLAIYQVCRTAASMMLFISSSSSSNNVINTTNCHNISVGLMYRVPGQRPSRSVAASITRPAHQQLQQQLGVRLTRCTHR